MRKGIMFCLIFITLIILAISSYRFLKEKEQPYVATINGEKISISEYALYLLSVKTNFEKMGGSDIWDTDFDGEPTEDVAKQNALESVTFVKISIKQGEKLGITLTTDEMQEVQTVTESYYNNIDTNLIEKYTITKQVLQMVVEDNFIQQKTFKEITKNYVLSPEILNDAKKDEAYSQISEEELKEKLTEEKKKEMYLDTYNKWRENAEIIKNMEVWDTIYVSDF